MFEFLTYVRPAWYYRLHGQAAMPLYAKDDIRAGLESGMLQRDDSYRTSQAVDADLLYQALRAGLLRRSLPDAEPFTVNGVTDVRDNYRFIRTYFSFRWSLVTLLYRIATFHDPFVEISAFAKAARKSRRRVISSAASFDGFREHAGGKLDESQKVSVIIPTLNRYAYLKDVLADLEGQSYRNFEVIVCDQSDHFEPVIYDGWTFPVKVLRQQEKALWLARNRCIVESKGDLILLFDDDSRVGPDWIQMHVACLSYFSCDISAGVTDTVVGNRLSDRDFRFHYSDVFDTGNSLVRRRVFEATGLFDRQFEKQRMGDGEFGLRSYLAGHPSVSNPCAIRKHLKVETGGLREFGSWDAFRPGKIFSPRPVPSVLYFVRRYFGEVSARFFVLNSIVSSVVPYRHKNNPLLKLISPLLFIPLTPVILLQVMKSWRLSSTKLAIGPLVEPLADPREVDAAGKSAKSRIGA